MIGYYVLHGRDVTRQKHEGNARQIILDKSTHDKAFDYG
jgi:hypothetical protein